jgi:hypothetical protein
MDIFSFAIHFTNEQSCKLHYKKQRDKKVVFKHRDSTTTGINGNLNLYCRSKLFLFCLLFINTNYRK